MVMVFRFLLFQVDSFEYKLDFVFSCYDLVVLSFDSLES